jgi:hypothetical protein
MTAMLVVAGDGEKLKDFGKLCGQEIYFGFTEDPIKRGNDWHLTGRCASVVHVGNRFTKFVPTHLAGMLGSEKSGYASDEAVPVDLTIVQIKPYQRVFDTLLAGMTVKLVLSGNGERLGNSGSLCGLGKV